MMRILLDTNIILDVLLNREPFVNESARLWRASDEGRFDARLPVRVRIGSFEKQRGTGCQPVFSVPNHGPAARATNKPQPIADGSDESRMIEKWRRQIRLAIPVEQWELLPPFAGFKNEYFNGTGV